MRKYYFTALCGLALLTPVAALAQTQYDLDQISQKCGLPKGKLELKSDSLIILHASMDDTPQSMACSRTEINKIPGTAKKLAVSFGNKGAADPQ